MRKTREMLLVLVLLFSVGCAAQSETLVKNTPLSPTQQQYKPVEKIVYVEKLDPNSIKITNLVWDTSENLSRIKKSLDYKFIFDLGVAFQIGISDGFGGRKTTRDERAVMYPIIKEYSDKDKIKFIDLNVAYEGGFDLAIKYIQSNKPMMAPPPTEKPVPAPVKK